MENGKLKMENEITEVEKMYGKVGIKFIIGVRCKAKIGDGCKSSCPDCDYNTKPKEYPQLTAEKQLKLLCFIVNKKHSVIFHDQVFGGDKLTLEKIQENLTWAINRIWKDLTEQEKTEIRSILECY